MLEGLIFATRLNQANATFEECKKCKNPVIFTVALKANWKVCLKATFGYFHFKNFIQIYSVILFVA